MASVAVVLGAGGMLGGAYHAGALAALEEATGFDARRADLLVGTSAGSISAASLRAGVSPHDQLARVTGRPLSPEGRALLARGGVGPRRRLAAPRLRLSRPASPLLMATAWLPFGGVRPGVALAGALPAGSQSTEMISEPMDRLHGRRWPDDPTWIVVLRLRDGARIVVGRDRLPGATIGLAVAASSAIPGYFRPVEIGDERYVDGGAHSPTNADVCAGLGFDLVVVVSPMSGTSEVVRRPVPGARLLHARALAREVAAVKRTGTAVLTIQPTRADGALVGGNPMDFRRSRGVAERAQETVAERLADPQVQDRVELLRAAHRRSGQR
jgi:NTE family protein